MTEREGERVRRVRRRRLGQSEGVANDKGDLSLLRATVPDDGRLHLRRGQLDDLAAPSAEHGEQRPPGLRQRQRRLREAPEERRLDDGDVRGEALEEPVELRRERGERLGTGVRPPG
jgi:hypothetical protein